MVIDIRPLGPRLLDDYLDFFDNIAFTDNPEWADCYCAYYHLGKEVAKRIEAEAAGGDFREAMRNYAIGLVRDGTMRGYLAYAGGRPVGWCNVADKRSYLKLREDAELWNGNEDVRTKSVVCFVIAPGARRQGVATALLERAVTDAEKEGYRFIEAYPMNGDLDCYRHFHGHPEMYRRAGFEKHRETDGSSVYRKSL